jgi:hypothetical protein
MDLRCRPAPALYQTPLKNIRLTEQPPFCSFNLQHLGGPMTQDIARLFSLVKYSAAEGILRRVANNKPVYLEVRHGLPYMTVEGARINARRAVIALMTGRWPDPHEYRFVGTDPKDLRWELFYPRREPGKKACRACGVLLPLRHFNKNPQRIDKRGSYCKDCLRDKDKHNYNTSRVNTITRKYNISRNEYESMVATQNNKCAICNEACVSGRRLAIDHCHESGRVRGLLCRSCNVGLGHFKDNPKLLLLAAKYLLKV